MTEADQRFLRRILMLLVTAAVLSGAFAGLHTVQASNSYIIGAAQQ